MKTKFSIIMFCILVVIIILQYATRPAPADYSEYIKIGGKEYILLSSKIDTIWIEGETIIVPEYIPTPGEVIYTPMPIDVDTTAILKEYFAKYFYLETVPLDSIGTVQIIDTISTNRIISRQVLFDYTIPIITNTTIVKTPPTNQFYLGGGLNFDTTDLINSMYGSALFKTKKDKIFALNIGASTSKDVIKPYIGGAMYWKITTKKK